MSNKLIRVAMAVLFAAAGGMASAAWADDAAPQTPPAASAPQAPAASPPAAAAPAVPSPAPPPGAAAEPAKPGDSQAPQGDAQAPQGDAQAPQGDSTGQVVDLTARPFAYVEGKADKDEIFASITASLATAKAAVEKAGLKIAGKPLAVFLQSDETGFTYRAGYPLESAAQGQTSLSDAVKLGQTPAGKAMRFQHAGAYSDIDATYDAITAYLDEKGIDAEDSFIEEYQNDVKDGDDPNLQVNIYVMTK